MVVRRGKPRCWSLTPAPLVRPGAFYEVNFRRRGRPDCIFSGLSAICRFLIRPREGGCNDNGTPGTVDVVHVAAGCDLSAILFTTPELHYSGTEVDELHKVRVLNVFES